VYPRTSTKPVAKTMQKVVTNQANPFLFGGSIKFAVMPSGVARAGFASRASSSEADEDMVCIGSSVICSQQDPRGCSTGYM
jgi:hypothetical protein